MDFNDTPEQAKGKEKHAEDHHQRHYWVRDHQLNQKSKIGTSIA